MEPGDNWIEDFKDKIFKIYKSYRMLENPKESYTSLEKPKRNHRNQGPLPREGPASEPLP